MLMANEKRSCGRSEALVAYLYGELPEADAQEFSTHAAGCTQCSAELIEFGGLHRSMSEWRTATVGQMALPAIEPTAWMPETPAHIFVPARRPVWSMIVEFFTMSPLWAQAGVALGVLLLVVLGVVYVIPALRSNTSSVATGVQPQPANPAPVAPVVDTPPVPPTIKGNDIAQTPPAGPVPPHSAPVTAPKLAANRHPRRAVVAPTDITQRQELARLTNDLLGAPSDQDTSVPRLSDLLTDGDVPVMEPNQ